MEQLGDRDDWQVESWSVRGTHDEGVPSHDPAFFVNGFHETWPIPYGESAFGFATTGQTIVSAPDGSVTLPGVSLVARASA